MNKLCDRIYGDASLYSMKRINGVPCCPSCEQPAVCHGKTPAYRALYWALSGDTGVSSETMARWFALGLFRSEMASPPSDADDRGRCIRLLQLIPEWIPRLQEMVTIHDTKKPSEGITISSSGISAHSNSWAEQIPLILKEGKL